MLRALWFFAQLAIVVCGALWLIAQKGAVDIQWNNYTISLQLGMFLLCAALFVLLCVTLFRLIGTIVDMPRLFSRNRKERNRAKGFRSLTRGFVAIAAGDAKKAGVYAKEARNWLPDETGLPLLLEAQAARLRGEENSAREIFEKLLTDKDAAFFGVRGLLKSSLDEGDTIKALSYAKTALDQNPKQPWILKSVYDLQLQNRLWVDAYDTLTRLRKLKVMDDGSVKKDEVTLLILLAERDRDAGNEVQRLKKLETAVKINPAFVPAVTRLAEYYWDKDKKPKISGIIERAWKYNPHPDLLVWWEKIAPEPKSSDPSRRLRWFEKLVALKPESVYGQRGAAKAAMDCALWGVAKTYLNVAESIRPSAQIFRLHADLEEQTTRNAVAIRNWLEKAASAPAEAVWFCNQTGYIYDSWSPVAQPHGAFNSIEWGHPHERVLNPTLPALSHWQDPLMVEKI